MEDVFASIGVISLFLLLFIVPTLWFSKTPERRKGALIGGTAGVTYGCFRGCSTFIFLGVIAVWMIL